MPIFEYICNDCGHEFEELSGFDQDNSVQCPHCETSKVSRLPSSHGGYHIRGNNSASTRPKGSGSRTKSK